MGRYLLETLWIVGIQLLIGRWLVALILGSALLLRPSRRRSWLRWLDASRSMAKTVYPTLSLIVISMVLYHLVPALGPLEAEPRALGVPGLRTLLGAGICAGCWLLIAAGNKEAAGRLAPARRLSWTAGRLVAGCAGLWIAAELLLGLSDGSLWAKPLLSSGIPALGLVALAGFAALMAALTRKPRPTGAFAALCYLGALLCRALG